MMADLIRVRLVPRNRRGEAPDGGSGGMVPIPADGPRVDPIRSREALSKAAAMGLDATLSPQRKLDGLVPVERFEELFGTKLVDKPVPRDAGDRGSYAGSSHESLPMPAGELAVPDWLKDEVAFAYVPTPPRFFAIRPIPPTANFHHLRLEDMARLLGAYRCHRMGWTGRGIRIAMADSGFATHTFFDDYGFNIQRLHTPMTANPGVDDSGHGTGESANALIVAPDCDFVGVKHDDYSAQALELSIAQNPRILTNSWGWDVDDQSSEALKLKDPNLYNEFLDVGNILTDAVAAGLVVIFSAGNGQRPFPGSHPSVISAGGTFVDADGQIEASDYASSFVSQLYPNRQVPDLCGVVGKAGAAPLKGHLMLPVPNGSKLEGENLPNTSKALGWGVFSGTSAAAPQIAGVAALMLSLAPGLTPSEVKSILMASARDVIKGTSAMSDPAGPGADPATGTGLVDAFAACARVLQIHGRAK